MNDQFPCATGLFLQCSQQSCLWNPDQLDLFQPRTRIVGYSLSCPQILSSGEMGAGSPSVFCSTRCLWRLFGVWITQSGLLLNCPTCPMQRWTFGPKGSVKLWVKQNGEVNPKVETSGLPLLWKFLLQNSQKMNLEIPSLVVGWHLFAHKPCWFFSLDLWHEDNARKVKHWGTEFHNTPARNIESRVCRTCHYLCTSNTYHSKARWLFPQPTDKPFIPFLGQLASHLCQYLHLFRTQSTQNDWNFLPSLKKRVEQQEEKCRNRRTQNVVIIYCPSKIGPRTLRWFTRNGDTYAPIIAHHSHAFVYIFIAGSHVTCVTWLKYGCQG